MITRKYHHLLIFRILLMLISKIKPRSFLDGLITRDSLHDTHYKSPPKLYIN